MFFLSLFLSASRRLDSRCSGKNFVAKGKLRLGETKLVEGIFTRAPVAASLDDEAGGSVPKLCSGGFQQTQSLGFLGEQAVGLGKTVDGEAIFSQGEMSLSK